jgi:competence CoiA-like predicted nuclease
MPWLGINEKDGKFVNLKSDRMQKTFYNPHVFKERFGSNFKCPTCGGDMHVVKRPNNRMFFRHNSNNDELCIDTINSSDRQRIREHERNTNHSECVIALISAIEAKPPIQYEILYGKYSIVSEYPFKSINRRADIAILDKNNQPVEVHECQLSKIASDEIIDRTNDYNSIGIECTWYFGLSAAEDASLLEWFIRKYGYIYTPFKIYNHNDQ